MISTRKMLNRLAKLTVVAWCSGTVESSQAEHCFRKGKLSGDPWIMALELPQNLRLTDATCRNSPSSFKSDRYSKKTTREASRSFVA